MSDRIYPVPIKPSSEIRTWRGWPDDVRPVLEAWNGRGGDHSLSFPWFNGVFKCIDCEGFCRQAFPAKFDGDFICDECLIARARNPKEQPQ